MAPLSFLAPLKSSGLSCSAGMFFACKSDVTPISECAGVVAAHVVYLPVSVAELKGERALVGAGATGVLFKGPLIFQIQADGL